MGAFTLGDDKYNEISALALAQARTLDILREAEDICHEVILKMDKYAAAGRAYAESNEIGPDGKPVRTTVLSLDDFPTKLVRKIVRNTALDAKRKLSHSVPMPNNTDGEVRGLDQFHASAPSVEELLISSDSLDAMLALLPPDIRLIVVLRVVLGLNYDEISEVTSIIKSTLMTRYHRAIKTLRHLHGFENPE